jgi:hypothetical protein
MITSRVRSHGAAFDPTIAGQVDQSRRVYATLEGSFRPLLLHIKSAAALVRPVRPAQGRPSSAAQEIDITFGVMRMMVSTCLLGFILQ